MENKNLQQYCDRLVGRIFKILKILDENPSDASKYLTSLLVELDGAGAYFEENYYFTRIVFSLKGIQNVTDYNVIRSKIFECISLANKLKRDFANV